MYLPSDRRKLDLYAELPARFREPAITAWAERKGRRRHALSCFLEGPAFDADGNLFVVDIPFGRIFRYGPNAQWTLVRHYDGWPNGMKVLPDGRLLIADHKLGLLVMDRDTGDYAVRPMDLAGDALLGLNDVTLAGDGSVFVTDQGDTGLNDPSGRVLHVGGRGETTVVMDNGPSPNGIVFDEEEETLYVAMTRANAVWRLPLRDGRAHRAGIAIQLSGGIGPDGLAFDGEGGLLVVHPGIGLWRFDKVGRPVTLFEVEGALLTNLAVRGDPGDRAVFVTDSPNGRIYTARL